jgi:subtilase family serine protease
MRRRFALSAIGCVVLAALVFAGGASAAKAPRLRGISGQSSSQKRFLILNGLEAQGQTPPTDASCRARPTTPHPCYSPQEIRNAYGVDALINRGDQGSGQTVVIIDSYGSPTIASDLATFDAGYGLPDPPSFRVISPLGTVPYDPTTYPDQPGWAEETTLDVEWAHAMAPKANIVLLTSPVDETEGVQGLPQFDQLINYALDRHLGNVISESWGATENGLFDAAGEQVISEFNRSYARAAAMGVTAIASTGDDGTANLENDLTTIFPFATVNFPASSPLVAAIGGTSLFADTSGDYQSETVWNQGNAATGGGISQQFREPFYQAFLPQSVQQELGGKRGIPDVSWNADPGTSILIYLSIPGLPPGYYAIGGTSEGSPSWAGAVADLDQLAGHGLGLLDPYAYALGSTGRGFHDVTVGNNSIEGIPGYSATPGWDLATGWGSPNFSQVFGGFASLFRGHHSMRALVARAHR